ncbi:hypothetical protein SLEP1_g50107 [Rubroshorea leprosula]|uniref:Uncharacterized protein n=1 Tax=Rubroshorea leprosula TaxID=152421 RepID=A0AAV5M0Z3_9ROSI|nr:hypothetical protein SLEP1_g50107 [Rubroshorea leprosula]
MTQSGLVTRKWSPAGRVIAGSPIKRGRSMMFWLRHGETFRAGGLCLQRSHQD